jgi:hypothetical protein
MNDLIGYLFLGALLLATLLLVVAARRFLPERWWIGAAVSGRVIVGLSLLIVSAIQALGPGGGTDVAWLAIAAAGGLGFLAGLDVQLLIGVLRRSGGGTATVVAGAILGPMVIIGGYALLLRAQEWAGVA